MADEEAFGAEAAPGSVGHTYDQCPINLGSTFSAAILPKKKKLATESRGMIVHEFRGLWWLSLDISFATTFYTHVHSRELNEILEVISRQYLNCLGNFDSR
jgi:hypothetical protein